jgi:hypothetical protein
MVGDGGDDWENVIGQFMGGLKRDCIVSALHLCSTMIGNHVQEAMCGRTGCYMEGMITLYLNHEHVLTPTIDTTVCGRP